MLTGPLSLQVLTRLLADGTVTRRTVALKVSDIVAFVFNSGSGAFVVLHIINPRSRTCVVITFDFYS